MTITQPTIAATAQQPVFTATSTGQLFTMDELNAAREAARKESNDRLYGELQKLREHAKATDAELEVTRKEREEREAAARKAQEEAEAAARRAHEEETSAKQLLEEQRREFEERLARLAEDQAAREAVFKQEQKRANLLAYTQRRVAEERDEIAPELIDYIDGPDEESVEAAIANAKAKTASILEGVRQAQTSSRAGMPGVSTGSGNIGPVDQQGAARTMTAEDIAALPVNSPEYQALRRQYGMDRPAGGAGMFG
jgi:hypothetical protein